MILEFWVAGTPVPKGRPRFYRRPNGMTVAVTPPGTTAWERRVAVVAQVACSAVRWRPLEAEYKADITVTRKRKAGDLDNYVKGVMDACNGILWPDDRMVVELHARFGEGEPGVRVVVTRGA